MPSPIPKTPREFRDLARIHGSTGALLRWGLVFYGTTPLLAAARVKRAAHAGPQTLLVTGTQGKTTATRALRHVLGLPLDSWSEFNNNVRGEVALTVLREPRGTRLMPVEVSDGNGTMDRYARWLKPRAALVLNVGAEHLGRHRDLAWAAADMAPAVARLPDNGVAILNADDPHVMSLASRTRARIVTFGRSPAADVRLQGASSDPGGPLTVTLHADGAVHEVRTRLIGEHYAMTVAGVVATAVAVGTPARTACDLTGQVPLTPSRMEPFTSSRGALILSDDYKSTPETVVAGLRESARWDRGSRWAVLTALTNLSGSDSDCHRQVARAAVGMDTVVTVGPLWAQHASVWEQHPARVVHADSVGDAARIVADGHRADDLIYVKGGARHRPRRITLQLSGQQVSCSRLECERNMLRCEDCSLLDAQVAPP